MGDFDEEMIFFAQAAGVQLAGSGSRGEAADLIRALSAAGASPGCAKEVGARGARRGASARRWKGEFLGVRTRLRAPRRTHHGSASQACA
eukprot:7073119-Alexandrium_andersonii.AAC.1